MKKVRRIYTIKVSIIDEVNADNDHDACHLAIDLPDPAIEITINSEHASVQSYSLESQGLPKVWNGVEWQ